MVKVLGAYQQAAGQWKTELILTAGGSCVRKWGRWCYDVILEKPTALCMKRGLICMSNLDCKIAQLN